MAGPLMAKPNTGVSAAGPSLVERGLAALPLLAPGTAGLGYLALFGAPQSYILINAAALLTGVVWAMIGWLPKADTLARGGTLALILILALTLRLGPEADGITRWFALGSFTLHVGLLVIPTLAVLSARDDLLGPFVLLFALAIAAFQPDAASALALTGAAFGLALANFDRRAAAIGGVGLFVVAWTALMPNLAPQPFVERVLADLWSASPLAALALASSLIASLALILRAPAPAPTRHALAGALAGFILAALLGDYPTPLIGYGAASIIGLGLALPAIRKEEPAR